MLNPRLIRNIGIVVLVLMTIYVFATGKSLLPVIVGGIGLYIFSALFIKKVDLSQWDDYDSAP